MNTPAATFASERQLLDALTGVLKEEQRLLVAADAEGVAGITPRKIQLVQQLAAEAAVRHRALAAAGFAGGETGMEPWLAAQGPDVRTQWESLLEATREAKELNRVNGMLINKHMAHGQQLLAELGANEAGGNAAVYGPAGMAIGSGPSKKFVVG